MPRLLVSVRSAAEALAALDGGCDLLDVKEPSRGSLGAADPDVATAVCEAVSRRGEAGVSVSVALGELAEWPSDRAAPSLDGVVTFAKLGLSSCGSESNWLHRWRQIRDRFDSAAGRPLGWMAVLYPDDAGNPDPQTLLSLAATTGCRGILVDTYRKGGRRLFDHISPDRLAEWRRSADATGLLFAVAGSLQEADLPRLLPAQPDIVAIRGAACLGGNRTGGVSADAVRRFRSALAGTFAELSCPT